MRPPPRTTLFPYTTLFRSLHHLPRKLKVTITGCATRCVYPEVQDVAIFAVPDWERGGVGFRVRVGGGLSTSPRFSQDLGVRSEEHTSELQSLRHLVCRLLL